MNVVVRRLKDDPNRVVIHWLIRESDGPIQINGTVIKSTIGAIKIEPSRWRMACNPSLTSTASQRVGADNVLTLHSDDARAVTCPECKATKEWSEMMAYLAELVPAG